MGRGRGRAQDGSPKFACDCTWNHQALEAYYSTELTHGIALTKRMLSGWEAELRVASAERSIWTFAFD